jgi:FAD/FMN-containing dehydrogenase
MCSSCWHLPNYCFDLENHNRESSFGILCPGPVCILVGLLSPRTFMELTLDYRSTSCSSLLPACILVPTSAHEVATIITALLSNSESFAVKAGGHNPNRHYASVDGGPLINLKSLNEITYDASSSTVKLGPGNRWDAVANALETYSVTVVGGRIGHVGVGGYLVGGEYLPTV